MPEQRTNNPTDTYFLPIPTHLSPAQHRSLSLVALFTHHMTRARLLLLRPRDAEQMTYMVNHGLDVGFHAVSDAVHWVVGGCDEQLGGRDVVPTLDFLVSEVGMPVSEQVCTVFDLRNHPG